jgi:hypothetical protein
MTDTAAVAAAMTDTDDDDDEPRFSSAALCIELELVNHSEQKFHPEFTHQVFDGGVEYIRGYQPKSSSSVLATAMPNTIQHKSHLRHETATHEIAIHVTLAPSCRMCSLKIEAAAKKQHPHSDEQQPQQHCSRPSSRQEKEAKRRRRNNNDDDDDDHNNNNNNNSNEQAEGRANVLTPEMEDEEEEKPKEEQQQDSNKNEESEHEPMTNTSGNSNGSCSGEEEEDNEDTVHAQKDEAGSCRTPLAEVQKQLSRALPDIVNDDDIKVENDYLTEPFGRILQEYTRRRNSNSMNGGGEHQQQEFCITLAQGQDAHVGRYHHSVQRLARFFIETADDVDVSSTDDGGYWRILYLFCRHRHRHHDGDLAKSKYSLAGYVTLFHFASPFRKPRPGTIVRICQAMILPPFQRAGHGRQMLLTIHRLVHGEYAAASTATTTTLPSSLEAAAAAITAADHSDIVEINVESPAPAFVALRNRVDFEEFLRANEKGEPWIVSLDHAQGNKTTSTDGGGGIDATVAENVHDETFFQPLTEARAKSAATRAKITPRQIHIVYELDRLYSFQLTKQQQSKQNSDSSDNHHHHHHHDNVDENLEKQYRLMVKRRLKREHKEDLSACKGKTEMQTLLAKLYDDERSMYDVILASMLKQ